MLRAILLLVLTMCLGMATLAARDRSEPLTDQFRVIPEAGRLVVRDMKVFRHYEGLKHFARGRLLEKQERIPESLQAYDIASQFESNSPELIRHMLPLCLRMGQTASALRLMRRSLKIDPQQPDLWMKLSQELYELQRYQEVLEIMAQARKIIDYSKYPAFSADLFAVQGSCLEALDRFAEAADSYRHSLAILQDRNRFLEDPFSPTVEELPGEEAKLQERLARTLMKSHQHDAAMKAYQRAHVLYPRGQERLELNLAEVYLAAGKPEASIIHLEKVLKLKPAGDEAYRMMATALEQSGRQEEVLPMLEKMHIETPQHTAINLILAEKLTQAGRYPLAERLYREIFTVEQASFKEAMQGYYRLLLVQGKAQEALAEFDAMLRQPEKAAWSRAAVLALMTDTALLRQMVVLVPQVQLQSATRLTLAKACIQVELWPEAEAVIWHHLKSDLKPQETFLLLARTLLEQKKYAELAEACQTAMDHPAISQPLIFHVELAKAQARLRNVTGCQSALLAARELCSPGTTDEHKVLCTQLYTMHLLNQQQDCITTATALLKTRLAGGPWARQVRYILAHAYEARGELDQSLLQYQAILKTDPNDSEALAAMARCLLLQNVDLARAEETIRSAIELDLIEQFKRQRLSMVPGKPMPHPSYQATLGTIQLRSGKAAEGAKLLIELAKNPARFDPWVLISIGDAYLVQQQQEQACQAWKQALDAIPASSMMGTDLTPSLQKRLAAYQPAIIPAGALSSPVKP